MNKSRFTEGQVVSILKQVEGGRNVKDICREHGIRDLISKGLKNLSIRTAG